MKKKVSFIFLPAIFLLYLLVELFLKLTNSSLCVSEGCTLTDTMLKFDSIYLNYLGLVSSLVLLVLGILSYKNKIDKKFFSILLFSALFFEIILIGYQYFVATEICKFCLGVLSFLMLIAIFSNIKYFLLAIPIFSSVIMALSFLNLSSASALSYKKTFIKENGNYIIQLDGCRHCRELKNYLITHKIPFTKIDIRKIQSQIFLDFINIKKVPVLIVQKENTKIIIHGNNNIFNYFDLKKTQ